MIAQNFEYETPTTLTAALALLSNGDAKILAGRMRLISATTDRTLSLEDFLVDTMTTAIEPGEIVREIIVPLERPGVGVSYQKLVQPASGFAIVGVAARAGKGFARVGVTGLAGKAY